MTRYIINYPSILPFFYEDDSDSRPFSIGEIINNLQQPPTPSNYDFDVYIIDESSLIKPTIGIVRFSNYVYEGKFEWIDKNIPFNYQKNRNILEYKKSFDIEEIIIQSKFALRKSYGWITMFRK